MAILDAYPGLEVTIEVDGQRAQEYEAPADEVEARASEVDFHSIPELRCEGTPYTIKYIESKPEKPFAFNVDATNFAIPSPDGEEHLVEYKLFLDGTSTGYYGLACGTKRTRNRFLSGSNDSGWKTNKFQFSTLELGKIDALPSRNEISLCHEADWTPLTKWKEEPRCKLIAQRSVAHFLLSCGMPLT